MGRLLRTAIRIKGGFIQRSFEHAVQNPQAAQTALLLDILRHNQGTLYGREHEFPQIASPEKFAQTVPVNTFDDLSPYVERIKAGERNILTSDRPVLFNLTSGTTSSPKYVPVTSKTLALAARTSHQWLSRALRDHPAFLDHSILCISGAAVEGKTESGIPYGSASGMMYESMPRVLHRSFALPFALSGIKNHDLRYYLMTRIALEKEISFIVTPNPTTLVKLSETGIQHQEEIIRAISNGVIGCPQSLEKDAGALHLLDTLKKNLRPNRQRAKFLETVIQKHDRLLPSACWEKLRLIGCWLGGSIGFQAEKLSSCFGRDVPRRDIGFLASEGTITLPVEDDTPTGILALDNNYYEFIPIGESALAQPLQCHELECGRQYKIILTGWNGLYRYDIHDVIEVRGFYKNTPLVAFVRKGDDMLNITGEKLHVNHFIEVFRKLENLHGIPLTQFRVVPDYGNLRYEILIAPEKQISREFLKETAIPLIDESLAENNIEYKGKRDSGRLNPPCIHLMDESWIDDVHNNSIVSGHRDVQYKWHTTAEEMSGIDIRHVLYTVTI